VVVLTLLAGWLAWLPAPLQAQSGFDCTTATGMPQAECEALAAIYEATDGDNWDTNTDWLQTSTPCDWYGVTCSAGNVSELSLTENNLKGALPPEVGALTHLVELYLYGNHLTSVPSQIGALSALEQLNLGHAWLGGNDLTTLPAELGDLASLWNLSICNNQLTSLPDNFWNLTDLWYLYLSGNQLSDLPPGLSNLTLLVHLSLYDNQLTTLPGEIGDLGSLTQLSLNSNELTSLPSEIGNLTTLTSLTLFDNPLVGEIPSSMTQLQQLTRFTFYDTEWCVPLTGDVPMWLGGIPDLWGTGLICGEEGGGLSGATTLTDTSPVAGMQVNLYRSLPVNRWRHLGTTQTNADGAYQFTGLGQGLGIDYRVQFVDPAYHLAPQYYDAKPTIDTATVITITPGVPRTGIDAVLALPQPPLVEAETGSGSVVYNPDGTAQITIPAPNPSDVTVTDAVTCPVGAPSAVTLSLSTGTTYSMTNMSGDLYQITIPATDLTDDATLSVAATCDAGTTETVVGYIVLYDPSGYITDAQSQQPIAGALVTLYNVPGWEPKTGPDDDRPKTCESNLSKPADAPWSQPAPTDLGIVSNADVTPTDPRSPYQRTTVDGYYGWDVSEGCWYVTVEAEGYDSLTSPVVGVPPEVTDLNLSLTPEGFDIQVVKSATPTFTITNGSAITYTLAVSASTDTTLHLYDELDPNLRWQGFVGDAPETLTYTTALTGAVALSATTPLTVTFAAKVDLPAASFVNEYAQVSNTAYYYFPGETLSMMRPSNTVTRTIYDKAAFEIFLPLVVRES
jgi:hypothetical protein